MAYANPSFMVDHLAADAASGLTAITSAYAFASGFGKDRLVDRRRSALAKFATAQLDHWIELDYGAAFPTPLDRLWIPAGHNLSTSGNALKLYAGTTSNPATQIASIDPVSASYPNGAEIDHAIGVAAPANSRYVRVTFTGATFAPELGELWLGAMKTTVRGIDPGWKDPYSVPVSVLDFPSREIAALLSTPRRAAELVYHDVDEGGADEALLVSIAKLGRATPFLFWPPSSGVAPYLARLLDDAGREQDSPAPKVKLGREYRLRLLEQTS